jgi:hypothetical protein
MRSPAIVVVAILFATAAARAQEPKKVPKDSMRVTIPGCTKGYIFTAAPRTEDQPGRFDIPEGLHIRMNGSKKMMADIKAHEGAMIEITGLMKKDQLRPDGVAIGGGVRIAPGPAGGNLSAAPMGNQNFIDVESWRELGGSCPGR